MFLTVLLQEGFRLIAQLPAQVRAGQVGVDVLTLRLDERQVHPLEESLVDGFQHGVLRHGVVGAERKHRLRCEALAVPADADSRGRGPFHRSQRQRVFRVFELDSVLVLRFRQVFECVGSEFPYGSFREDGRPGAVLRDRRFDRYIAHGFAGDEVLGNTLLFQRS